MYTHATSNHPQRECTETRLEATTKCLTPHPARKWEHPRICVTFDAYEKTHVLRGRDGQRSSCRCVHVHIFHSPLHPYSPLHPFWSNAVCAILNDTLLTPILAAPNFTQKEQQLGRPPKAPPLLVPPLFLPSVASHRQAADRSSSETRVPAKSAWHLPKRCLCPSDIIMS